MTGQVFERRLQWLSRNGFRVLGLAEGLAGRIGHEQELRTMHREREVSLAELDAISYLRAEMDRLSDAKTAQVEQTPSW